MADDPRSLAPSRRPGLRSWGLAALVLSPSRAHRVRDVAVVAARCPLARAGQSISRPRCVPRGG